MAALKVHRRAQRGERLVAGSVWIESGKVFCTEAGAALHPGDVKDRFYELSALAGLPPIRLHDLRHGAASILLASGANMKEVQETLGHSSMALTANTYTSIYPEMSTAAAEAAARIVPRARRREG